MVLGFPCAKRGDAGEPSGCVDSQRRSLAQHHECWMLYPDKAGGTPGSRNPYRSITAWKEACCVTERGSGAPHQTLAVVWTTPEGWKELSLSPCLGRVQAWSPPSPFLSCPGMILTEDVCFPPRSLNPLGKPWGALAKCAFPANRPGTDSQETKSGHLFLTPPPRPGLMEGV